MQDVAVETALAAQRDVSEFLMDCTKRMGVVGDVNGELQALKEVFRALGFIDSRDCWSARAGTLVFTTRAAMLSGSPRKMTAIVISPPLGASARRC